MLGVYKVIDFQLAVSLAMTVLRGDVSNPLRASLSIRYIFFRAIEAQLSFRFAYQPA